MPDWFLPAAAVTCYSIPVMIMYLSGDMDKDRFKRARTGVTLKERAVDDFVNGLQRGLQRVGVLAEPATMARSQLGCKPPPQPGRQNGAPLSVPHLGTSLSQAAKQSARRHHAG